MLRKMKSEFIRYQVVQASQHAVKHHAGKLHSETYDFLIQATV